MVNALRKLKLRYKKDETSVDLFRVFKSAVKGYRNMRTVEKKSDTVQKVEVVGYLERNKKNIPEEKEPEQINGIEIIASGEIKPKKAEEGQQKIGMTYPLIPSRPRPGEEVFASASIRWSPSESALVYIVTEPALSENEKILLEQIKASLIEKLDVDFTKLRRGEAKEYLERRFSETVSLMAGELPPEKRKYLLYYVERDFIGLGKIEPLLHDPNIEDISCDGVKIPIFIYHRNGRIGTIRTNISYGSPDELDSFTNKLAQRSGKTISVAEPLLDASLPDGSRIQLTLGTDIAKRGSNFTIRKFTENPLSPIDMMKFGTLDSKILSYLWMLTEYNKSTLIGGGTATGKTSLLNALSLFIKPDLKIVTIEDTSELRLPHAHWVPQVARQPMAEVEGRKIGEVDMFDLLRESLRQRPDFIIVGEVRGQEAFVLFQQIASIPGKENVVILNDNHFKRIPIEELVGKKFRTFALDPQTEKICIKEATLVKHSEVNELIKIKTMTGREIVATPSHSFFTYKNGLVPAFGKDLKEDSEIVVPAALPCGYNDIERLNLLDVLPEIRVYSPELIKRASRKLSFENASKIAGFTTISNYYGVNNCALPAKSFVKLMEASGIEYEKETEKIKVRFERNSSLSEASLEIIPEFLRLLGYYISEGSINTAKRNNAISLYNKNEEILSDMRLCIEKVSGKKPRERITHGFGTATELTFNHKTIFEILKQLCGKGSGKKRIPTFVFGLSKNKIGEFLSALYSGDGYLREREFGYCTCSKELADDLMHLLLVFNIVASIRKGKGTKQQMYEVVIYRAESQERFSEYIKPFRKIPKIRDKRKTNSKDIFLDKIKNIETIKLKNPETVYDISVEGVQNFIGGMGGVLLHNTGHPGLATIHADTMEKLVDRLTTPPIELPPSLLENLDVIIFLVRIKYGNKYVRRASAIFEVTGFDREKNAPTTNMVFKWDPVSDRYNTVNPSVILRKISDASGLSEVSVQKDIKMRIKVMNWLMENDYGDYRIFAKVMKLYYTEQDKLLELIESGS